MYPPHFDGGQEKEKKENETYQNEQVTKKFDSGQR